MAPIRTRLAGLPLLVAGLLLAGCGGNSIPTASQPAALHGVAAVQAAYDQAGYAPPSYTTVQDRASGICSNLATGMDREAAAQAFSTGFSADINQARPVVSSIADNMCPQMMATPTPAVDEQSLATREAELGFSVSTHADAPAGFMPTERDNIELGQSICQGFAGGQTPTSEVANLLNHQFTYANAVHYVHMSVQYFCPAYAPSLTF